MLSKILIINIIIILIAESKSIIKATEKNFPSFVSLTDGKELLNNQLEKMPSSGDGLKYIAPP